MATVVASPTNSKRNANEQILIWDTLPGLCATPGSYYIHFAGEPDGIMRLAMMANAGDDRTVHSYKAALFDTLPVPAGTTGCFRMKMGCQMVGSALEWKVARLEATCGEGTE